MKRFLKLCAELCFPPRCVGCGERLAPTVGTDKPTYFCKRCVLLWQKVLVSQCADCHRALCECDCQPSLMKRAGSVGLLKLAPYDTEKTGDPMVYAIRSIKKHPRERAIDCLAHELAPILEKRMREEGEKMPVSHTVMAYIPRARWKIRRFGFDHAEALARRLSQRSGVAFLPLLVRLHDGREQKKLTQKERQENLKGAFGLKASPKGLCVILVDDVVTTGADMAEATRLLRRGGAARVLCLSAALTPKKKGTSKHHPQ